MTVVSIFDQYQVLQDSSIRKEELRARAKGLKTLGKIFQVQFVHINVCVLCASYVLLFLELSFTLILQRVKLNATDGEPAVVKNIINNSDDNDGSSPDSSPKSPRDQIFDTNPPYAQVLILMYDLRAQDCFYYSHQWEFAGLMYSLTHYYMDLPDTCKILDFIVLIFYQVIVTQCNTNLT
jgi:hypothetical protein